MAVKNNGIRIIQKIFSSFFGPFFLFWHKLYIHIENSYQIESRSSLAIIDLDIIDANQISKNLTIYGM